MLKWTSKLWWSLDERLKSLIEDNVIKVISIEYPTTLKNCNIKNDNIDIFVKLENGNKYWITVATIDWISDHVGERHLPSGSPDLIVKELQNQLIEDAVKEYSEDDAYWLRVFSMSYGDEIPDWSALKTLWQSISILEIINHDKIFNYALTFYANVRN